MGEARIELLQLTKTFRIARGEVPVLRGLNLALDPSGITVLVGRSGCGKTTLLRLMAGLLAPTSGRIAMPEGLKTGMVFQEARLMPWLTCEKNVTLGLKRPPPGKARDMLRLVGLEGFAGAYPAQLSGGMQQRAALARTLMRDAGLLLMDEPFAALDSFTRETMQQELLRIRRERGCGVILVTHSIDEALILGERIVLLSGGTAVRDYALPRQSGARDILSPPFLRVKKDILTTMKELEIQAEKEGPSK